jgi:hypothetical protein
VTAITVDEPTFAKSLAASTDGKVFIRLRVLLEHDQGSDRT